METISRSAPGPHHGVSVLGCRIPSVGIVRCLQPQVTSPPLQTRFALTDSEEPDPRPPASPCLSCFLREVRAELGGGAKDAPGNQPHATEGGPGGPVSEREPAGVVRSLLESNHRASREGRSPRSCALCALRDRRPLRCSRYSFHLHESYEVGVTAYLSSSRENRGEQVGLAQLSGLNLGCGPWGLSPGPHRTDTSRPLCFRVTILPA